MTVYKNLSPGNGPRVPNLMNGATDYYLNEARNGDFDAADNGLIELPDDLLRDLEDAYRGEPDFAIRALIVEAVWQHRLSCCVDFLALALEDPHHKVWKQAVDGLVTLASSESRKTLELAKSCMEGHDATFRAWVE